jgi:SNF2 family DNA or RNA helicase
MTTQLDIYLDNHQLTDTVYAHQKEIIRWMHHRTNLHLGSLNADTMGLGKTLDICILLQLAKASLVLVVAPTSCVYSQWARNLCQHSFHYHVYVLKSGKVVRIHLDEKEHLKKDTEERPLESLLVDPYPHKIVVTNYHAVRPNTYSPEEWAQPLDKECPELSPFPDFVWDIVVADEIHVIRNEKLMYRRMSRLRSKVRIGLSGTPIQNRLSDIVSILTFLGAKKPTDEEEVMSCLREYMFRRTEHDLSPEQRMHIAFPELPFQEIVRQVVYTEEEEDIYRCLIGQSPITNTAFHIQQHPCPLVTTSLQCYLSADINMFLRVHNQIFRTQLPAWTGTESKMNRIVSDIERFASENISFICFTHYYAERATLVKKIEEKGLLNGMGKTMGYRYFDINGSVSAQDRDFVLKETQRVIARGERCICFATVQTCSDGLNMQHFYTGIFTSSHWNPALELQAIKRMHRIGQRHPVTIYRYVHTLLEKEKKHIDDTKLIRQGVKKDIFQKFIGNHK